MGLKVQFVSIVDLDDMAASAKQMDFAVQTLSGESFPEDFEQQILDKWDATVAQSKTPAQPKTPKFKVGEKVWITKNEANCARVFKGDIGTIVEVDERGREYVVQMMDAIGEFWSFEEEFLRNCDDVSTFQEGSRIEFTAEKDTNCCQGYKGRKGTLVAFEPSKSAPCWKVAWDGARDDDFNCCVFERDMKVIEGAKS